MIIVTGGAGFVGSNIVHELNRLGETEILVVDNLNSAIDNMVPKFTNLLGAVYADYMDKREFRSALRGGSFDGARVRAILHQGACTNTFEEDGRYMMDSNFTCSKELLHFALEGRIPFVYASSAAIYGANHGSEEIPANESPLNIYGYSKLVFDNYVRRLMPEMKSSVVGLRYFNVYGPRELHKGRMASVVHHFARQLKETGVIRMFQGSGGYGDGQQRRDFIFVRDIVRMNLFFAGLLSEEQLSHPVRAVVNAGTGESRSFKSIAEAVMRFYGKGRIEFIPFPDELEDRYQSYTQADSKGLHAAGYKEPFTFLEEGLAETFASENSG